MLWAHFRPSTPAICCDRVLHDALNTLHHLLSYWRTQYFRPIVSRALNSHHNLTARPLFPEVPAFPCTGGFHVPRTSLDRVADSCSFHAAPCPGTRSTAIPRRHCAASSQSEGRSG